MAKRYGRTFNIIVTVLMAGVISQVCLAVARINGHPWWFGAIMGGITGAYMGWQGSFSNPIGREYRQDYNRRYF